MLQVAQSPISGHQRPRSGRKPLQLKNSWSSPIETIQNVKAVWVDENNKENAHPIFSAIPKSKKESFQIESLDASLAEELSAIREKLERVRTDKEKTDEMLRERAVMLDSQLKEMIDRGMLQKQLEIEVDRLFRLKEIKFSFSCTVGICIMYIELVEFLFNFI